MLNKNNKNIVCDICGEKSAHINRVTKSFGKGINLIIIENIPLINCTHCGESYFTADTLYEIERIKLHRKSIAKQRKVSVANFA